MAAKIISGLEVSAAVKERVKKAVEELKVQGVQPCLARLLGVAARARPKLPVRSRYL